MNSLKNPTYPAERQGISFSAPAATRIYPCRSTIPQEVIERSYSLLRQGAILEKTHLRLTQGPLVRIVSPGNLLFHSHLVTTISETMSACVQSIHVCGSVIQSWACDQLHSKESAIDLENLRWKWQEEALSFFWRYTSGLMYDSAHLRLANLFLYMAENFGIPSGEDRVLLPLRLGIQDLAGCIGSTRETASTALNRFKRHNLVNTEQGLWVIAPKSFHEYREKL